MLPTFSKPVNVIDMCVAQFERPYLAIKTEAQECSCVDTKAALTGFYW